MRLTPADENLLRWYVLDSDADMGLRSPVGAMLERARLRLGDIDMARVDHDRPAVSVERASAVRNRLREMGRRYAIVLTAAYCSDPVAGLTTAARLGAIAPFTTEARTAYMRQRGLVAMPRPSTVAKWLAVRWKGNTPLREAVLAEADALLTEAVKRWRATRPKRQQRARMGATDRIWRRGDDG